MGVVFSVQHVVKVIEDEGIGREVYQEMLAAYQGDESLRQKIDAKLQAMLQ